MEAFGGRLVGLHVKRLFCTKNNLSIKQVLVSQASLTRNFSQQFESLSENDKEIDEIEKKRDVSRLPSHLQARLPHRRNAQIAMGTGHFAKMKSEKDFRKWQRKMYGKYGSQSDIDPALLWPSIEKIAWIKQYEADFETPLEDMIKKIEAEKAEDEKLKRLKEERVLAGMAKMAKYIEAHHQRLKKSDAETQRTSEKKAKLLMEAREYYGYNVDPRDEKFKQMMLRKQEEAEKQKKMLKKQKKKMDQEAEIKRQIQAAMDQKHT